MEIVIGDNAPDITNQIEIIEEGGPAPAFLIHGAQSGNAVPDEMLRLYEQLYADAKSVPRTTGLSYRRSLKHGGSLPYDGKG